MILILRATSIFHSVRCSDFRSSNLTGNNCTYCGGSIEDNYPPAGELDHQDHPLYHAFISAGDQDSPVYQSNFTKRNIVFKLSLFSDCRGGPLLPLWHHRLLHAQRETMRQVQSKFLLKKAAHQDAQHSDNEHKHKALVFHWIGSLGGRCDKIWLAEEVAV